MKHRLAQDDKELLAGFAGSDMAKSVMSVLNVLGDDQNTALNALVLPTASDRDLVIAKARAEGAAKLIRDFRAFLDKIKKKA